jgi:hypothetical protein
MINAGKYSWNRTIDGADAGMKLTRRTAELFANAEE